MATALGAVGDCIRLSVLRMPEARASGEPDVGNLHLRFDEGRVGRAIGVASLLSTTVPLDTGAETLTGAAMDFNALRKCWTRG